MVLRKKGAQRSPNFIAPGTRDGRMVPNFIAPGTRGDPITKFYPTGDKKGW